MPATNRKERRTALLAWYSEDPLRLTLPREQQWKQARAAGVYPHSRTSYLKDADWIVESLMPGPKKEVYQVQLLMILENELRRTLASENRPLSSVKEVVELIVKVAGLEPTQSGRADMQVLAESVKINKYAHARELLTVTEVTDKVEADG